MTPELLIVPAVSLRGGSVVMVRGGAYEPVEDEAGEPFAIDEFAEVFLKDFKAVLVFDIDGLEGDGAQFDEVGRLDRSPLEVWWNAGARDHVDVVNLITSGADKAVLSTRTLRNLRELDRAVELTENVVFEAVFKEGVVQAGSREFAGHPVGAVVREAARAGAEEFLLLDAARPLGGQVDWRPAMDAAGAAKAVFVGGGIGLLQARALAPPAQVPLKGAVVDLISVLSPYL